MRGPVRIQRKRTKGWKMPHGAIYVGRPTKYGNPFTGPEAAQKFREHVKGQHSLYMGIDEIVGFDELRRELRGHDLACWCPLDQPCHADVLLELANAPAAVPGHEPPMGTTESQSQFPPAPFIDTGR